jgi:hypothetical protein
MGEENSRIHFRFLKSEKINCYHLFENEKRYDLKSPFAFVVKDLSIGGMGILTHYPLKVGQVLSFHYTFYHMPYQLMGKVVWARYLGGTCKAGLEFIATPNNLILEIKAFLKNTTSELEENWLK